jgi:hypothetical protein
VSETYARRFSQSAQAAGYAGRAGYLNLVPLQGTRFRQGGQSSVRSKMIKRLGEIGPQILDMLDPN